MKWRILSGALVAALVVIQAGCDTCCRKSAQLRPAPCCPPGGAAAIPAPPPSVSQFPPATPYGH